MQCFSAENKSPCFQSKTYAVKFVKNIKALIAQLCGNLASNIGLSSAVPWEICHTSAIQKK